VLLQRSELRPRIRKIQDWPKTRYLDWASLFCFFSPSSEMRKELIRVRTASFHCFVMHNHMTVNTPSAAWHFYICLALSAVRDVKRHSIHYESLGTPAGVLLTLLVVTNSQCFSWQNAQNKCKMWKSRQSIRMFHVDYDEVLYVVSEIRDCYKKFNCRIWGSHSGVYEEFYLMGYNVV
jgi:hypothetical protein